MNTSFFTNRCHLRMVPLLRESSNEVQQEMMVTSTDDTIYEQKNFIAQMLSDSRRRYLQTLLLLRKEAEALHLDEAAAYRVKTKRPQPVKTKVHSSR